MARNRKKIGSLLHQLKTSLDGKLAIGQSKYNAKLDGTADDKIFSWNTYRTYLKQGNYFMDYCKEKHNCKTLEECKDHLEEYFKFRKGQKLSNYTLKLDAAALSKIFDIDKDTREKIFQSDKRERANIVRSRRKTKRDKHFSLEKNINLVEFCKSTGLRRSELAALTGDKLLFRENMPFIKVDTATKGGRLRVIPVVHNQELVIQMMKKAGKGKVFEKIHNAADIHSYRRDYCTEVYNMYARKNEDIPKPDRYVCRKDKKGKVYDKAAMEIASMCLGHNRISVIAGHYLD